MAHKKKRLDASLPWWCFGGAVRLVARHVTLSFSLSAKELVFFLLRCYMCVWGAYSTKLAFQGAVTSRRFLLAKFNLV